MAHRILGPAPYQAPILLVEDDALVRIITSELLSLDAGLDVLEASNADEALLVLQASAQIRLLITDVEMPGTMDGFALARLVGRDWPHIGILALSGHRHPGPTDLPAGAHFFAKPYAPSAFLAIVARLLVPGPRRP
jgi:CheY-like chemotaxis protein